MYQAHANLNRTFQNMVYDWLVYTSRWLCLQESHWPIQLRNICPLAWNKLLKDICELHAPTKRAWATYQSPFEIPRERDQQCRRNDRLFRSLRSSLELRSMRSQRSSLRWSQAPAASSKKPPSMVLHHRDLRTHLTNRKWKPSESAAVPRFQMNGQINIHVLVS